MTTTTYNVGTVVKLCDECYEYVTDGLLAECQDFCSLQLDHAGLCSEHAETDVPCDRCGDTDMRMTGHEIQDGDEAARMGWAE